MAEPQPTTDNVVEQPKSWWRNFVPYVGPGFLISLAYLDPGNLETNLQAGANHRYELLWVLLLGLVFALIIQSLAVNLGVVSGKHLAEVCKAEYSESVNYCLWILAEIALIAADIPKVIGTAFALNILFNIPVWVGVLCTGCSTLILLALESYGIRKLELLIAISVFVMAGCFYREMSYVKPPAKDVIKGIFVPQLRGKSAVGDAIALFGALILPSYNLFLHSALVLSRKIPSSARGIKDACRFFLIESGFALAVAFLINVAVISVSGKICSDDDLSQENVKRCSNLTLNSASFLLQDVLGRSSSTVYAVALLASGQSSTITGTYAGQYIMQGFLDLKMKTWVRNLMTRSIAITPCLVVSLIGGSSGASQLIIIASMILSLELPFALIPLLKFSSSSTIMGPYKNAIYIIVISWILGLGIIGMNVYYFTAFIDWILHNHLDDTWNTLLAMFAIPSMFTYLLFVIYLAFRKDEVAVFIHPTKFDPIAQTRMESGGSSENARNDWCLSPYREDLVHSHTRASVETLC